MKKLSLLAAFALVAPALAGASDWEIDPVHSSAQFSVKHMMVTDVRGEFSGVTGKVHVDDQDPSKITLDSSIDTNTVDTRNPKRDTHLKSPDFLDVAKFPKITFKSKKVEKVKNDHFRIIGDLTLHGVTHEVPLEVSLTAGEQKDPMGNIRRGGSATTQIKRKDYGLNWNVALESGGWLVSDDVRIDIDVSLIRKDIQKKS